MSDRTLGIKAATRPRAGSLRELLIANLGLVLMVLSWGAFFPVLEQLLLSWDPFSATLARQLVGTVVLFSCVSAMRRREPLLVAMPWKRILILGGAGVTIGSLLTSLGVLLSSGLSSAIISTTNPIGSALTAALLFREPLGRGIMLGTALSVTGGLISALGGEHAINAQFRGGEILIIIANVLWTWMSIAAQRWLQGFSQLQISALTVGAGAFWLMVLAPIAMIGGIVQPRIDFGLVSLGYVAFAGAVPIALANFCWHYGVSRVGIVISSMYSNLLPAIALGVTVLMGGHFSWLQLFGTGIILAGVFIAQILALRG